MLAGAGPATRCKDGRFFRRPIRLASPPANIEIGGGGVFRQWGALLAMAVFFADTGTPTPWFPLTERAARALKHTSQCARLGARVHTLIPKCAHAPQSSQRHDARAHMNVSVYISHRLCTLAEPALIASAAVPVNRTRSLQQARDHPSRPPRFTDRGCAPSSYAAPAAASHPRTEGQTNPRGSTP